MKPILALIVVLTLAAGRAPADVSTDDLDLLQSTYEKNRDRITGTHADELRRLASEYLRNLEQLKAKAVETRNQLAAAMISKEMERMAGETALLEDAVRTTLLVMDKAAMSYREEAGRLRTLAAKEQETVKRRQQAQPADPDPAEPEHGAAGPAKSHTGKLNHLATGAKVTVSSTHSGELGEGDAHALVDGDTFTRWSSEYSAPQEIVVDLGRLIPLKTLRLHWEKASATKYSVMLSNNGEYWRSVYLYVNEKTDPASRVDEIDLGGLNARMIKLDLRKRVNEDWGFSMYEIEAIGAP